MYNVWPSGEAYNNDICRACFENYAAKFGTGIVGEGVFEIRCTGICVEQNVKLAMKEGCSEEDARFMFDPVAFFERIYGSKARWYQKRILYCTAKRLAGRQCRQTGKSLIYLYKVFQFLITNENKHVLVVVPGEKQISKLWKEYVFQGFINKSEEIKSSVASSRMSPSYEVEFCNGSKLTISIANDSVRGSTADWLYCDEASRISNDMMAAIIMTTGSRPDAAILYTSTPAGRNNQFWRACKIARDTNEFHVRGDEVEEMIPQLEGFRQLLSESDYVQEIDAEFPDLSGGPFNFNGIDLAQCDYNYSDCVKRPGYIYVGGCDWNGSGIGTYFYILEFDPNNYIFRLVDKQIISSATWNGLAAKEMLKYLNEKWQPNHWMTDFGYGHDLNEDLKLQSLRAEKNTPLSKLKHTIDPVNFGSWIEVEDPFSKELIKKSTKAFIVSQVARLFEPRDNAVNIIYSKYDKDLTESLENYKILNITDNGNVQYGFDKKDGLEDHMIDSMMLSVYGIVKNYSELFRRVFLLSVPLEGRDILSPKNIEKPFNLPFGQGVVLITDNSSKPIYLDERIDKYEPKEVSFISRTFNSNIQKRQASGINNFRRSHSIIKRAQ